jgi:hypothetical protein
MNSDDITQVQADIIYERLGDANRYLVMFKWRLEALQFPTDDPLKVAVDRTTEDIIELRGYLQWIRCHRALWWHSEVRPRDTAVVGPPRSTDGDTAAKTQDKTVTEPKTELPAWRASYRKPDEPSGS